MSFKIIERDKNQYMKVNMTFHMGSFVDNNAHSYELSAYHNMMDLERSCKDKANMVFALRPEVTRIDFTFGEAFSTSYTPVRAKEEEDPTTDIRDIYPNAF